ncbi:hypothetical protein [Nostoc sp. CMAA1605]|uniref:hypothetical protein n=1 Tax=Nostoc sp. CMAA1605 TaxID=2055159 RepID=UPI001F3DDEF8|nr:hypothetical protein [Nostoc sp. CMAA1605]MCF4967625.1 hypothetical protein [Nostoc sp. CMAA1605]
MSIDSAPTKRRATANSTHHGLNAPLPLTALTTQHSLLNTQHSAPAKRRATANTTQHSLLSTHHSALLLR